MKAIGSILLVEDDLADVKILQTAFGQLGIRNPVVHAPNGQEALRHLQSPGNPWPVLILLDLNMPIMNGFEFLEIIKADEALKTIPAIILTTSDQNCDVQRGYELGAAGYITKKANVQEFLETIKGFNKYWSLSYLPSLEYWPR
ncbi:MAG: response regulator [Phycisphaerae bacterium]